MKRFPLPNDVITVGYSPEYRLVVGQTYDRVAQQYHVDYVTYDIGTSGVINQHPQRMSFEAHATHQLERLSLFGNVKTVALGGSKFRLGRLKEFC